MLRAFAAASCLALMLGAPLLAQQVPQGQDAFPVARPDFQSPILTIKQQDLFEGSAFGRDSLARLEAVTSDIAAENRRIEADLEAEENNLTKLRPTMSPAEFRPLADAFDKKVEGIRNAQDAKSRDLNRQREDDRQEFFKYAVPVLAQIMQEYDGVVLMDQSSVVLSLDRIDITAEAISRIDAVTTAATEPKDGTPRGKP
jgi:Skp family chaperone for outer membrane proteins